MKVLKKIANFLEAHIEKIVLSITVVLCLVLLIMWVVRSPNKVIYRSEAFSPGQIDIYLKEQAKNMTSNSSLVPRESNNERRATSDEVNEFRAMLDCTIKGVDTRLYPPQPGYASASKLDKGAYKLPEIGQVTDVAVEHIRAAAYVPIRQVTFQSPYDRNNSEPNDIDLVTVQAKFDAGQLFNRFSECFSGSYLPPEGRDPCLAKPVFAAVQLQRRQLLTPPDPVGGQVGGGSWGDWQDVPRLKIDPFKRMFEIVEHTDNLPPGGIKVQMLQFDSPEVAMSLLQPATYQIASADIEWFPPLMHRHFVQLQMKEKAQAKRDALEEEKRTTQDQRGVRPRGGRANERTPGATAGFPGGSAGYPGADPYYSQGTRGTRGRGTGTRGTASTAGYPGTTYDRRSGRGPSVTRDPQGMSVDPQLIMPGSTGIPTGPASSDIYYEYMQQQINWLMDLSKQSELLIWAIDDTAEPGSTYQYRLRLGVFNPVAGTNQLDQQYESQKERVILWSDFSSITDAVEIPKRLYFFANEVVDDADKTVKVQVSKYVLGYWYSENFLVRPGENIGKVAEVKVRGQPSGLRGQPFNPRTQNIDPQGLIYADPYGSLSPGQQLTIPEKLDYSTGAVMVDVVPVSDWASATQARQAEGQLHERSYYDMLYSFDGVDIKRMPVRYANWPENLKLAHADIQTQERQERKPLRNWDERASGAAKITPTTPMFEPDPQGF